MSRPTVPTPSVVQRPISVESIAPPIPTVLYRPIVDSRSSAPQYTNTFDTQFDSPVRVQQSQSRINARQGYGFDDSGSDSESIDSSDQRSEVSRESLYPDPHSYEAYVPLQWQQQQEEEEYRREFVPAQAPTVVDQKSPDYIKTLAIEDQVNKVCEIQMGKIAGSRRLATCCFYTRAGAKCKNNASNKKLHLCTSHTSVFEKFFE